MNQKVDSNAGWAGMDPLKQSKQWLGVALLALTLAGLLSFVLVIGRAPYLNHLITDPQFAKRCLVVHVDLALFIWLSAILASLYSLLPLRRTNPPGQFDITHLALLGIFLFVLSAGIPDVPPVLSNYIPVLDHPVFLMGMGLVLLALSLTYLSRRFFYTGSRERCYPVFLPIVAQDGLRMAAIAFFIGVMTLIITRAKLPEDLPATGYYEQLFWGAGHVMQFINVMGMMSVWLILLAHIPGSPKISRKLGLMLFTILLLPLFYAPFIAFRANETAVYYLHFTRMMQWGIFPAVSGFIFIILRELYKTCFGTGVRSVFRHPGTLGLLSSMALTVIGFLLGAFIRTPNTLVPAHYHASIGAITVAYMAVVYQLLELFGLKLPSLKLKRLSRWQPTLFGFGQAIFAIGFATAGMIRKVYGVEQKIQTTSEYLGLGLMGLGGALAITGGVVFVWVVGATILHEVPFFIIKKRRALWKVIRSIPFRG